MIIGWTALAVSLVLWLMGVLVGHVVKMWREARKKQKNMGRLKTDSVWRMRCLRNNPFDEDARHFVTVLDTRVNSDGRMWVKYLHSSGLVETDPADVFVHLYLYAKGPIYAAMKEGRKRTGEDEEDANNPTK